MSRPNIVIVGAGAAGARIARSLSAALPRTTNGTQYNLILISDREQYVQRPALLRLAVSSEEPELEEKIFVSLDGLFHPSGIGRVEKGKVVAVYASTVPSKDGYVELEGGARINFRYLVVATGSTWAGPTDIPSGSKEDVLAFLKEWRQDFKNARSVVLAGAGSVGLELAGELRAIYPEKPITVVHSSPLALNGAYPDKFRNDVGRRWRASGVEFIHNDRIDFTDGVPSAQTRKGKSISGSLIVPTYGTKPNTSLLRTLEGDVLNDEGFVKIEATLQVKGHPNIFAAGDIISFNEVKQLTKVPGHQAVVVPNLLSLVSGVKPTKEYKGSIELIAISNGKFKGAGHVGIAWGIMLGDTLVPKIKGKGLFVSQARKELGVTD